MPVIFETVGHLAVIRINRPEASNAINTDVMQGLEAAFERAARAEKLRVVIVTGVGERSFAAGGDLKEFHTDLKTADDVYEKWSYMRDLLYRLAHFPKPVVAALNGAARGGGAELAMACHFRVASPAASIGFVQVGLGISPGWGGAALLARTVGYQTALRLLLTGQILLANGAKEIGLVDEVIAEQDFWEGVVLFANQIASHSPQAVQGILQMMRQGRELRLAEAMDLESRLCASLWNTDTHQAAIQNFLKRNKE